jgi:hypothetical protein
MRGAYGPPHTGRVIGPIRALDVRRVALISIQLVCYMAMHQSIRTRSLSLLAAAMNCAGRSKRCIAVILRGASSLREGAHRRARRRGDPVAVATSGRRFPPARAQALRPSLVCPAALVLGDRAASTTTAANGRDGRTRRVGEAAPVAPFALDRRTMTSGFDSVPRRCSLPPAALLSSPHDEYGLPLRCAPRSSRASRAGPTPFRRRLARLLVADVRPRARPTAP